VIDKHRQWQDDLNQILLSFARAGSLVAVSSLQTLMEKQAAVHTQRAIDFHRSMVKLRQLFRRHRDEWEVMQDDSWDCICSDDEDDGAGVVQYTDPVELWNKRHIP
jgi:hypothetical protein